MSSHAYISVYYTLDNIFWGFRVFWTVVYTIYMCCIIYCILTKNLKPLDALL